MRSDCFPGTVEGPVGTINDIIPARTAIFSGLTEAVSNLPISSAGGFTYQLDPSLGTFLRSTESFGPLFADRVETTGKRKLVVHASYSRFTFDEVDGVSLGSGAVGSFLEPCPADAPTFSPGAIRRGQFYQIREDLTADLLALTVLYGVTDRFDVSVSLPIIRVRVKERVRTTPDPGDVDAQGNPLAPVERRLSAEATGIGDVTFSGKYRVLRQEVWGGRVGLAGRLDVKVPTGSEGDRRQNAGLTVTDTLTLEGLQLGDPPLGTGIVRVRPQLTASGEWFMLSPHVNVGADLGTTQGLTNDLVYAVGLDYSIRGRVTLMSDLLGRYALNEPRSRLPLGTGTADRHRLTASFGVKANPIGTLIIFANVLIPITDSGLTDDLTPTVGVEWTF